MSAFTPNGGVKHGLSSHTKIAILGHVFASLLLTGASLISNFAFFKLIPYFQQPQIQLSSAKVEEVRHKNQKSELALEAIPFRNGREILLTGFNNSRAILVRFDDLNDGIWYGKATLNGTTTVIADYVKLTRHDCGLTLITFDETINGRGRILELAVVEVDKPVRASVVESVLEQHFILPPLEQTVPRLVTTQSRACR